jgi:cobalt-zinc-cadmium efflux system outer membrane protein
VTVVYSAKEEEPMICRQLAVYGAFTCLFTTVLAAPHLATPGANQPDGNSSRAITVEQAIGLALAHNPLVSANDATVRAAVGRERQAAAYPNPELELEVEDVGLGAAGDDFATSIYTVRLGQTFELGGKREARRRLAALQRELVGRETAIAEADLVAAVKAGFYELLTTQERVRALRTQRKLATEIRDTVAERVRSGKVSPVALTKAEVKLAGAEIDLRRAERTLAIARASLGSLWHASPEESAELEGSGSLQELPTLPALATLRAPTRRPLEYPTSR